MHFCQDEVKVIQDIVAGGGIAVTIGACCRYCWYKLTFWKRK